MLAVALIRDGEIDRDASARHRITRQELAAALRKQGVEDQQEVRLAMLEADGSISVVKARGT